MSTLTESAPAEVDAFSRAELWRVSVDQYHAMIEQGILTDDDPVELLEGILVYKMSKKPRHSVVTRLIARALRQAVPKGWFVDTQEPVTTSDSEPEPDISIFRGVEEDYSTRHPNPSDVALLVEVSDSTLARDRNWKRHIYARAGVPIYWVVDVNQNVVEVFSVPGVKDGEPDYISYQKYTVESEVPLMLDGQVLAKLAVKEILP